MDKAQVSYWDSLILAAAGRLGCSRVPSEDFQARRDFEGIQVINPFEESPQEVRITRQ
jgi:predicted nucleic acid-binding protein